MWCGVSRLQLIADVDYVIKWRCGWHLEAGCLLYFDICQAARHRHRRCHHLQRFVRVAMSALDDSPHLPPILNSNKRSLAHASHHSSAPLGGAAASDSACFLSHASHGQLIRDQEEANALHPVPASFEDVGLSAYSSPSSYISTSDSSSVTEAQAPAAIGNPLSVPDALPGSAAASMRADESAHTHSLFAAPIEDDMSSLSLTDLPPVSVLRTTSASAPIDGVRIPSASNFGRLSPNRASSDSNSSPTATPQRRVLNLAASTSSIASRPTPGPAGLALSDPRHMQSPGQLSSATAPGLHFAQFDTHDPPLMALNSTRSGQALSNAGTSTPAHSTFPPPIPHSIAVPAPPLSPSPTHLPLPDPSFPLSSTFSGVPWQTERAAWEPDSATRECHLCQRLFSLFTRRHHCRLCGRVCCAQCSRRRARLPQHLIVSSPAANFNRSLAVAAPGPAHARSVSAPHSASRPPSDLNSGPARVCDDCALVFIQFPPTLALPGPASSLHPGAVWPPLSPAPATAWQIEHSNSSAGSEWRDGNALSQYVASYVFGSPSSSGQVSHSLPAGAHASTPAHPSPQQFHVLECPVCTRLVAPAGKTDVLEAHVRACIESPATALLAASGIRALPPSRPTPARPHPQTLDATHSRYAGDRLAVGNPLLGNECPICMEDFVVADRVARMACLCVFHERCLQGWLARGVGCPTHRPPSPSSFE